MQPAVRPFVGLKTLALCASALTTLFWTGQAAAQAAGTELTEIVVTAQKRAENLQDVPIAVTAVTGQVLEQSGAQDLRDLQLLAPGLTMTATTSESVLSARLRGIGTVGDNPGLESSVGVVIDGVYRPRNGVGSGDLGETDRIEVLKGPQSTLFGKSTSAGVINIVTAAPSFTPSAGAEVTVGTYDAQGAAVWVNGPLGGDTVAGRLYFAKRKRDGFLNVFTGAGPRTLTEDTDQDVWTLRGQLLFRPAERTSLRLIADYTGRDENCCLSVQTVRPVIPQARASLVAATVPGSIAPVADPYARLAYANRSTDSRVFDRGLSGQIDHDFGSMQLTSISAFRMWGNKRGQDSDFTAADILYRPVGGYTDEFDTFSQEVRLSGDTGRLAWLVGGFVAQEDYFGRSPILYGRDYYAFWAGRVLNNAPGLIGGLPSNTFVPGQGQNDTFEQDATSYALFTNNTFDVTDAWDVTVGLRYSIESKALMSTFTTTAGSCARGRAAFPNLVAAAGLQTAALAVTGLCLPWENEAMDARSGLQKRKDTEWSGTLKSSYRLNPDAMVYGSYARGFKAGGFNFDRPNISLAFTPTTATMTIAPSTAFAAETVDAFELGAKTEWFEKRLALNVALFHQTYDNFQLNSFVGTQFVVESLPEVTSKGVDFEFLLRSAIEGLTLQGGVTYAQTEISPFVAADLTTPANFAGFARLPGSRLSFAPLWSGSVAANYERPVGAGLTASFNVSAKLSSSYNTGSDLAPQKVQESFSVVNARVGLGSERWRLEAWAANLFDTEYQQVSINSPLQGTEADPVAIRTYNAFLAPPRTYGLTLRLNY